MTNDIAIPDLLGRFYLKKSSDNLAGQYAIIQKVRSLFDLPNWGQVVHGFYLNGISRAPSEVTLRISYFAKDMSQEAVILQLAEAFAKRHELIWVGQDVLTDSGMFTDYYGGDELLFRRYLATYSWIGMDLLENDFENSTRLFSELRKQPRVTYRAFLEPTFLSKSPYFVAMSKADQEEFWQSFVSWPKSNTDWAHMMVNMMIGRDQKPLD